MSSCCPTVWLCPQKQGCQVACVLAYQKSLFGNILEGLGMENVGIFKSHFVHFLAFGIFSGHLVYFYPFWYIVPGLL
jgi:hypothetical protein